MIIIPGFFYAWPCLNYRVENGCKAPPLFFLPNLSYVKISSSIECLGYR